MSRSDLADAFRYSFDVDFAKGHGLTVAKLCEAKRRLLDRQLDPPIIFDELHPSKFRWFCSEAASIDKKVFDTLNRKTEIMETLKKAKVEKFNTIGVRFPGNPGKEYTYKVRVGAKPYLGQELVADTDRGQAVVFVTRIDKTPKPDYQITTDTQLKYIDRKAVAL